MSIYQISLEAQPQRQDLEFLNQQLLAFNQAYTGRKDERQLVLLARDETGTILGGLAAWTFLDWLMIDILWVREDQRGQGLGRDLLRMAEEEAVTRGCHSAQVDTFNFQAPGFYEKYGYRELGRLQGYAGDNQRIYFYKPLR